MGYSEMWITKIKRLWLPKKINGKWYWLKKIKIKYLEGHYSGGLRTRKNETIEIL